MPKLITNHRPNRLKRYGSQALSLCTNTLVKVHTILYSSNILNDRCSTLSSCSHQTRRLTFPISLLRALSPNDRVQFELFTAKDPEVSSLTKHRGYFFSTFFTFNRVTSFYMSILSSELIMMMKLKLKLEFKLKFNCN